MQSAITTKLINTFQPQQKPIEIRDTQLKGLLLRIQPTGVMTYYLEYKRGKRLKIGRADAITPFQARELARQSLAEVYQGADPSDKRRIAKAQTYLEFLTITYKPWLLVHIKTGVKTALYLEKHFPELHKLKLGEISQLHLEKWRSRRIKEGRKAATINRELGDLRAMLSRAKDWGILESHPLDSIKPLKVDSLPKVRYLLDDEELRLREELDKREQQIKEERVKGNTWRAIRGYDLLPSFDDQAFVDYLKPAVLVSLGTGLRRGELFSLKWTDIHIDHGFLTVVSETTKTGKTRHIPLNDEVSKLLQIWKAQQASSSEYVFVNKDGQPFHDLRKSWANVLKKAEIKDFRWHDLRHTFASHLVMEGVDLNTVRELLGHADYKTTLRYAHLAPKHKALAVNVLVSRLERLRQQNYSSIAS